MSVHPLRSSRQVSSFTRKRAAWLASPIDTDKRRRAYATALADAFAQLGYLFAAAFTGVENQNGYGASAHAAAPYQIANAKLATPRPGATAVSDDLSGWLASAAPKPVDRIVIDRPVKMASAPREDHAEQLRFDRRDGQ